MGELTTHKHNDQSDREEISLKDFIIRIRELWKYLITKWKIILIVGFIGAAFGLLSSYLSKRKYTAKLTFVVEDTKSGPLGAYMGLASQFGIDLGGGGSASDIFSNDNIIVFLKSRLLIEKTLLSPVLVDDKKSTLANLYLDFSGLHKKWEAKPVLKDINFPLGQDRKQFSLKQDSILYSIQSAIVDKLLEITKPDKKSSFILVKCTSLNETFSKVFTETLVNEATRFYIDIKTKRSKTNVGKLQASADSLRTLLDQKTYNLAATQDLNLNPARQITSVNSELQSRDKMVLQTMYGEVVKNLEISKMTMEQETPLVQIIDVPIYPLESSKIGKLKGLILGGLAGALFIVFMLLLGKIYRDL
jgi:uncharacterized protein involved in exopolysaccharide biosynthesis